MDRVIKLCSNPQPGKSVAIHKWYGVPNPILHPDLAEKRQCLTCLESNIEKLIIAKDGTTSSLIKHLATHRKQYQQSPAPTLRQQPLQFPNRESSSDFRKRLERGLVKWIVHDCLPFHCVESVNLRHVFEILHPHCPVYAAESIQHRIAWLYVETKQQLQRLLHGKKGLSFTTDHWTSMAGDNYVSLTVHYIKDYERVTHILACTRHEGTTSSEEMYVELIEATLDWGVKIEQMFALVSDTEGKMNRMGIILERERTRHLYCAAHNFQLTAVIAFSASIDGVTALHVLVAFIRKSTQASNKLKASQVNCEKRIFI